MARGFHSGPVFGIFGAAIAAAKISGLDAEQIHGAIAQCVNLAAGNLEGGRSGGRSLREGGAVRNALLAVALAKQGMPGGETVLEGEAGFYTSYAGNNRGKLSHAFEGPRSTDLDRIGEGLGKRWQFLETLYRIHSVAGFNIAHIDVTAALCADHDIRPENIDRIEAVVNWFETVYPSPQFPAPGSDNQPKPGSTHYYSAYAAVERGFPLFKTGPEPSDPPAVADLMQRVTLVSSKRQTLFGPKITIFTRDGKRYSRKATGREFIWDFDQEVRRLDGIAGGIPIPAAQYARLVEACRHLQTLPLASDLIRLTIPGS
jgi:2-methylcitrate dehydratase PrpD